MIRVDRSKTSLYILSAAVLDSQLCLSSDTLVVLIVVGDFPGHLDSSKPLEDLFTYNLPNTSIEDFHFFCGWSQIQFAIKHMGSSFLPNQFAPWTEGIPVRKHWRNSKMHGLTLLVSLFMDADSQRTMTKWELMSSFSFSSLAYSGTNDITEIIRLACNTWQPTYFYFEPRHNSISNRFCRLNQLKARE